MDRIVFGRTPSNLVVVMVMLAFSFSIAGIGDRAKAQSQFDAQPVTENGDDPVKTDSFAFFLENGLGVDLLHNGSTTSKLPAGSTQCLIEFLFPIYLGLQVSQYSKTLLAQYLDRIVFFYDQCTGDDGQGYRIDISADGFGDTTVTLDCAPSQNGCQFNVDCGDGMNCNLTGDLVADKKATLELTKKSTRTW